MGLRNSLRARRRALLSVLVWIVAFVGVVLLNGPVDTLPGFACFLIWNIAGIDLCS